VIISDTTTTFTTPITAVFNGNGSDITEINADNISSGYLASSRIANETISNAHINTDASIEFSKLNITKENIISLGIPDSDSTLSQEDIDTFVEDSGYLKITSALNGDFALFKDEWTRFPKGENGQVLYIGSDGYPTWTDLPENIFTDITDISTAISNLGLYDLAFQDSINDTDWDGEDLSVENGGTGASTAEEARINLDLGDLATASTISNSNWSGTDLSISNGGTGASTVEEARGNLALGDLAIESSINNSHWDGTFLSITNGGTGASSATSARTNLGLGTLATASSINSNNWDGTDLSIANGGTGASTALGARSNLELGSLATASSINNNDWDGMDLTIANGGTGASSALAARENLGLGSLATKDTISNTNWGLTDLSIANGGTGASSSTSARANLGLNSMAIQSSSKVSITGGNVDVSHVEAVTAEIDILTVSNIFINSGDEGDIKYNGSKQNFSSVHGVAMMASGRFQTVGDDVRVILPYNWTGGKLEVWVSRSAKEFQGHGYNNENFYQTTFDALYYYEEQNVLVINDDADWYEFSDAGIDLTRGKNYSQGGTPISATPTSFTIKGTSGYYVKWMVTSPGMNH